MNKRILNIVQSVVYVKTPVELSVLAATILVDYSDGGRCSGFLIDYPSVVAQGETKAECAKALERIIPHAIKSGIIEEKDLYSSPHSGWAQAAQIIDDFLNAGDKKARAEAAKKGRAFYESFYGVPYKNRNER